METKEGGALVNSENIEGKSDNAEEGEKEETGVSPARWWVLTIFSLLGMVQCMIWNTWGPVKTLVF